MLHVVAFIILGILAGVLSGIIGIGGGIIIVPALVLIFGLSQQQAQGTTLALLVPPVGILAAWTYYKQGYVDFKIALLICLGFVIGGLFGSGLATHLQTRVITRLFGIFLLIVGLRMVMAK
ncbi:MAG: hypothetical protein UV73_C0015G0034 [Candidatus Gottesmanbacteria bacterium GW2011_GWA2_43_14]|uniref:Probable membrane transporter protein n=1 Tax=Candidatus Gottesmanbacteria bacterium GW2011_GWA2_43_14 TaxID=1618443 RepID=A0A0G1DDF7_9BACT|nr:MAG: hypothetical protein UV73_C0015G0034 [Candidatus Gottesmanbacteria bacterium GW2011_GWA2_43_14]